MTIPELIEKILPGPKYDPAFAKKFKTLSNKCREAREKLIKSGTSYDKAAAKQFLKSWSKLLSHFADDPKSLAALSVPPTKKKPEYYCYEQGLEDVTVLQNTMTELWYYLQKSGKPKSKAKPYATSGTSKKTRTSKVK